MGLVTKHSPQDHVKMIRYTIDSIRVVDFDSGSSFLQFIIPESDGSSVGKCERNPCPRAHLYFPDGPGDSVKCHKVLGK